METYNTQSTFPHQMLFDRAYLAGLEAADAVTPTPVTWGFATSTYYNSEGNCGYAWVILRPGNSSFARSFVRWMVNTGLASKLWPSGFSYWVNEGGQSVERKAAFAEAFARVINEAGIRAEAGSRLD